MGVYGNALISLNELYYGKSPTLLQMEDQIGVIRSKLKGNYFVDIDKDPEVIKLNRLFEKQFGMDIFALHVVPTRVKNAWTVPVAVRFDIVAKKNFQKMVLADKKSFKFKPGNNLCIVVNVTTGILNDDNITNEEVLAIMLHELGHNYADAIDKKIYLYNQCSLESYLAYRYALIALYAVTIVGLPAAAALAIDTAKTAKENNNEWQRNREETYKQNIFTTIGNGIGGMASDTKITFYQIMNIITGGIFDRIDLPLAKISHDRMVNTERIDKTNEIMADKFAAMWGYSTAVASGLAKMDQSGTPLDAFMNNIPYIGAVANETQIPGNMISDFVDCHPNLIKRIDIQIQTLERELQTKAMDPKMEKMVRDDIADLKAQRDELVSSEEKIMKDPKTIRLAWYHYISTHTRKEPAMDKSIARLDKEIDNMIKKNIEAE